MPELIIPRNRFVDLRSIPLTVQLQNYHAKLLGWGFYEPEWWRNYSHIHSFFEVCYAYQGYGTFHINREMYRVQCGDVFIAKPNDPHEIISSEDDPLGIYFWSYTLVPASKKHEDTDLNLLLRKYIVASDAVGQVRTMQQTISLMTEEIFHREVGYVEALHSLVTKLLLDTARAVTRTANASPIPTLGEQDNSTLIVRDIVRYLHDNFGRSISIRDVAAQVHLSERHTSRLFRRIMETSINDYLTQYRLQVAAQRLLNRDETITATAYACGYPDVRYFTTLFRREHGLTPTDFREQGGTHFLKSS